MTATVLRRNPVHHAGRGAVHERAAYCLVITRDVFSLTA